MSSDKITLTGATLSGDIEMSHSHSHSHSHGHSDAQQSADGAAAHLALTVSQSIEDVLNSSLEEVAKSLSTLLRFGRYEALEPLLEQLVERKADQLPQILSQVDDGGHSVLHWAAKRVDDIRFLNTLVQILVEYKLTKLLNLPRYVTLLHPPPLCRAIYSEATRQCSSTSLCFRGSVLFCS